jgi:hypothetical protein
MKRWGHERRSCPHTALQLVPLPFDHGGVGELRGLHRPVYSADRTPQAERRDRHLCRGPVEEPVDSAAVVRQMAQPISSISFVVELESQRRYSSPAVAGARPPRPTRVLLIAGRRAADPLTAGALRPSRSFWRRTSGAGHIHCRSLSGRGCRSS